MIYVWKIVFLKYYVYVSTFKINRPYFIRLKREIYDSELFELLAFC